MSRRPMLSACVALGASALLAVTAVVPAAAQGGEAAPMPAADTMIYPNYGGEVDCEAGTFNGSPYSGNLKSIEAPIGLPPPG